LPHFYDFILKIIIPFEPNLSLTTSTTWPVLLLLIVFPFTPGRIGDVSFELMGYVPTYTHHAKIYCSISFVNSETVKTLMKIGISFCIPWNKATIIRSRSRRGLVDNIHLLILVDTFNLSTSKERNQKPIIFTRYIWEQLFNEIGKPHNYILRFHVSKCKWNSIK